MDQLLGVRVSELTDLTCGNIRIKPVAKTTDVGIEFEVEGSVLPVQDDLKYHWKVERDGSLRGEESFEYVLKKPYSFGYFKSKAFPYLTKVIKRKKTRLDLSERCSTHVHINVQSLYVYQVYLMWGVYHLLEDLTDVILAPHRLGNLFAVSVKDSALFTQSLVRGTANLYSCIQSSKKYSAVNLSSLPKYGSLEFRALQGSLDPDVVNVWIEYLLAIRDYCKQIKPEGIQDILGLMSLNTPSQFLENIIGDTKIFSLIKEQNTVNEINNKVYQGTDRVQALFYEPPWTTLFIKHPNQSKENWSKHLYTSKTKDECRNVIKFYGPDGGELNSRSSGLRWVRDDLILMEE